MPRLGLLRRTPVLRVISVDSKHELPPDRAPDISYSGPWVRERMIQLRKDLGMSEEEIDAMIQRQRGEGGEGEGADKVVMSAVMQREPTWKEIVDEKKRRGELYAPKTIRDAFPYLSGQPAGVPEFGDKLRREQMLAQQEAQSINPMDIMMHMQIQRVAWVFRTIIAAVFGYSAMSSYLYWHEYDADPDMNQATFYMSKDDAYRRVQMEEEPMQPILQNRGIHKGYTVVWVPQSKVQHMMWYDRQGESGPGQASCGPLFDPAEHKRKNFYFPPHLASLVGNADEQMEYQMMQDSIAQQSRKVWGDTGLA